MNIPVLMVPVAVLRMTSNAEVAEFAQVAHEVRQRLDWGARRQWAPLRQRPRRPPFLSTVEGEGDSHVL